MKSLKMTLAAVILAGCASAPPAAVPSPGTAEPAPALQENLPQGPRLVERTIQVQLPVTLKSLYSDGALAGTVKTSYDAAGLLRREDSLNASGVLTEYRTGAPEGGKYKISNFSNTGELQSYKLITFGPRNRMELEDLYNGKGQLQTSNTYVFDETDRVTSWTARDGSGNILAATTYSYGETGLSTIELKDEKGSIIKTYIHAYGENGRLAEKKELEADGSAAGTTLYTYDSKGLLLKEEVRNGQNVILRVVEYSYGNLDVPVKTTFMDRRGKVTEIREAEYAGFPKTVMERK